MKVITSFVKRHPFISCLLTAEFAFFITLEFMFHAFGEPPLYRSDPDIAWWYGGAAGMTVSLVLLDFLFLKPKAAVGIVLALALATVPLQADEPKPQDEWLPGLCVVGVVCIVVGFVACKCVKRGNKIANGRTNGWPDEVVGPSQSGAAFSWAQSGYCPESLTPPGPPVAFTMRIKVESATKAITTMVADVGPEYVQSVDQYRQELAASGLVLASSPGQTESYALDGKPAKPDEVPIRFDWATRTATVGAGTVLVTVEASDNLTTWDPILRIKVVPGAIVEVSDATESGMSFYRVSLSQ